MQLSAALCREQERLQRERAASTTLANVRVSAERAAEAWRLEALSADKREQRQERRDARGAVVEPTEADATATA